MFYALSSVSLLTFMGIFGVFVVKELFIDEQQDIIIAEQPDRAVYRLPCPRQDGYNISCFRGEHCPDDSVALIEGVSDRHVYCSLSAEASGVCCIEKRRMKHGASSTCGGRTKMSFELAEDNSEGIAFKIGSRTTRSGEFPWIVRLTSAYDDNKVCGGTIVSPSHVLTKADCVTRLGLDGLVVSAGFLNPNSSQDTDYYLARRNATAVHEQHGVGIAVLTLDAPLVFGDFVRAACLPHSRLAPDNVTLFVAGWGAERWDGPLATAMRMKSVRTWHERVTGTYFSQKERYITHSPLLNTSQALVATGYFEDPGNTCKGDGGGPAMFYDEQEDTFHVAAIILGGRSCRFHPGANVFLRVHPFVDWVKGIING